MKRFIFATFALMVLAFTSCQPNVSGDFLYSIMPSSETATGVSMSWQTDPLGEPLIDSQMEKIGATQLSSAWKLSGNKKDCDSRIKNAVDAAMDAAEKDPEYCSFFDFSGMTVVVKCSADENGESNTSGIDYEIYRRTYKTK